MIALDVLNYFLNWISKKILLITVFKCKNKLIMHNLLKSSFTFPVGLYSHGILHQRASPEANIVTQANIVT